MFRTIGAMVLSCSLVSVAYGQSPRFCRAGFAPDEKIETRFMGLGLALTMYALAEKYCGAVHAPMGPGFLGYLEKQGCGPETEIYREVQMSIERLERSDLRQLAQDGDPALSLSEEQVQEWASHTAKELGGCDKLIAVHKIDPRSWQ